MVRYVQCCGSGLAPAVAVRSERRLSPLTLHSVDFVDGRFIPLAAVDRCGILRFAWVIGYIRYLRCCGRFKGAEIGRK
jgi:hypothetical protein